MKTWECINDITCPHIDIGLYENIFDNKEWEPYIEYSLDFKDISLNINDAIWECIKDNIKFSDWVTEPPEYKWPDNMELRE